MSELEWFRVHFRTSNTLVQGQDAVERLRAKKSPKAILVEKVDIYKCDVCNSTSVWTEGWTWCGSYDDLDNDVIVPRFCSSECRNAFIGVRSGHVMNYEPRKFEAGSWKKLHDAKRAADVRHFPFPTHPAARTGKGWCCWCGDAVNEPRRRTWHSACLAEYFLHTSLDAQFDHLVGRDGWGCAACAVQAGRITRGHLVWHDPYKQRGRSSLRWSIRLQVDHVIPLWAVAGLSPDERRQYHGPENLWLLCEPCHVRKTSREASDRAAGRIPWSTAVQEPATPV